MSRKFRKLRTPPFLPFFVTNRCNLKCQHCFYWKCLNVKRDEMNLEQIEAFVSSLKTVASFHLTGGEAVLRDDLPEIAEILHKCNGSTSLKIATNGFATDRICNTALEILKKGNIKKLTFQVSLDGLKERHDRIRGVGGSFNRAIETIDNLCELKKKYPGLNVSVFTVIMRQNYKEVEDLVRFTQKFRIHHGFAIVRGGYSVFNLDKNVYSEVDLSDEEDSVVSLVELDKLLGRMRSLHSELEYSPLGEFNLHKLKVTLDILKAKKRIIPCYAGKFDGVVYANGDVSLCETTKPIGNLKETKYDFNKLWNSERATEMRKKIKACECIHGCNLVNSIGIRKTGSIINIIGSKTPIQIQTKYRLSSIFKFLKRRLFRFVDFFK